MPRRVLGHLIGLVLVLFGGLAVANSEILWDTWGVPHIYADTEEELLYAWGWAQMHSHGNLLLEQFGIVRGKASEYWGEAYLESDRYVWTMGLPQLVDELSPLPDEDDPFVDFDTHSGLADQVLDTVIALGRQYGSPEAQEAAEVLAAWDRRFDADSVGAVVFAFWAMNYQPDILGGARFPAEAFAVPFDPGNPLETPEGLADSERAIGALEFAARAVKQAFGALQVPWGAFYTFRVGDTTLPGFGAPPESFGVFSPNFAAPTPAGPLATVAGDTWVAVIEFGDTPTAWAVLPYGNASQAGDPHVGDQLALYAGQQFRPVWYARPEVEANLERTETFE